MDLKEGDVVMCTVKSIEGATIFLEMDGYGAGTMMMSEVAAGRIRNLREYVVPNKKIVCKILKMNGDRIELSLRRVTGKERDEIQERYKKERTFLSLLKTVVKSPGEAADRIRSKYELWEFFDEIQKDTAILAQFFEKGEAETIAKILTEKEDREKEAKKVIVIKSTSSEGVEEIREALSVPEASVRYLGSSQFSISVKGSDFKEANNKLLSILQVVEKRAKEKKLVFEIKEK